jgi:hypothetical protein
LFGSIHRGGWNFELFGGGLFDDKKPDSLKNKTTVNGK